MASIWSAHVPGINVRAEVTGGSVSNVIQVARGESDLGIAMADVISDAYKGEGLFPESLPLRVLLSAYPNVIHVVTVEKTNISSISDLAGKRVSLGAQGSGPVAAQNILSGLGLQESDYASRYLSFTETTAALKDGAIDAGFIVGGLNSAITDLAVSRPMRLIGLSKIESERPKLVSRIQSSPSQWSYRGIEEDVDTLGSGARSLCTNRWKKIWCFYPSVIYIAIVMNLKRFRLRSGLARILIALAASVRGAAHFKNNRTDECEFFRCE